MAAVKVIRNKTGVPFSKWKPAEKFAHIWKRDGLEGGEPTLEHKFASGRNWRLDFAWPNQMVAVEIDGFGYGHQAQQCMAEDNEKSNAAVEAGWRVLRFNSRQFSSKQGVVDAVDLVNRVLVFRQPNKTFLSNVVKDSCK